MSEKVKLPKKVAESLDEFKGTYEGFEWMVLSAIVSNEDKNSSSGYGNILKRFATDSKSDFQKIISSLVNGYEVEETPEDKVREAFQHALNEIKSLGDHPQVEHWKGMKSGIIITLGALNIKIEGVNA